MNVLFITHCTPMDGGNQSLLQLMKELREKPYGITPVLLTPIEIKKSSSSIVREAGKLGIKCISARFYPFKYTSRSPFNLMRYASNAVNTQLILHRLRNIPVDIVHSNSSIFDIGARIARQRGVPHIWHLREFGDLDFNLVPLFGKGHEKSVYSDVNSRFIAISARVKERFSPYIDADRISIIYNGIRQSTSPSPNNRNNAGDTVRFCMVGALNEAKRQTDAIDALDILVNRRYLKNMHLTIIGEGPARKTLENKIAARGLGQYATLAGWQQNPELIYSEMDAGLMLSTNEAFGRVTIEYMRSGLLVIASDGGANRELVTDGVNGLLFPTGDIEALAEKMEYAITERDKARTIAGTGYEFSRTHFLSSQNTKAIYEIYTHGTSCQ